MEGFIMTITLNVQGMTCNHCKMSVTNALTELEGVQNVEVHLQEGTVNVEYDDTKVDVEKMKEVIEDQGYDVI
ncbi:Copper chaperone copZ [Bacillus cereus 95/8201]|jgi:copper chaperone|nr:Copper chaperone copZ [Bacillus cereus R309803]EEL13920.1 Copper chaperone copZ [Bacillus cereus 95/8201]EEL25392.1 Copper chaperone copZ [Bacillus cereus Rock1-15]